MKNLVEINCTSEMKLLKKRIEINFKVAREYEEMISALSDEIKAKIELLHEYRANLQVDEPNRRKLFKKNAQWKLISKT